MIIEILVCWALGKSVFWPHIPWRVIQYEYSFIDRDRAEGAAGGGGGGFRTPTFLQEKKKIEKKKI